MKAFTTLITALTAGSSVSAAAADPRSRALAEEAHHLAAELAAVTDPFGRHNAVWACVARNALRAEADGREVLRHFDRADYCGAYDAAGRLHEVAEEIQDDVERLDIRPGRWSVPVYPACADLEVLADRLADVSRDLRRAARRLDQAVIIAPPCGCEICGTPFPAGPASVPTAPGGFYEESWQQTEPDVSRFVDPLPSSGVQTGPAFGLPPAGAIDTLPSGNLGRPVAHSPLWSHDGRWRDGRLPRAVQPLDRRAFDGTQLNDR